MDTFRIKKVCRTDDERRQGLIGDPLADGEACLFVFDADSPHAFHNRGVVHDTWVSSVRGGVVVDSAYMAAGQARPIKVAHSRVVVETLVDVPVGSGVAIGDGRLFVS